MIASVGRMMRKGGGGHSWPAGMKEHIKAWYDPKKQGMTNFDVIESYAEDFTTWVVNKEGVIANVTSKSITITNVLNSNPLIYAYGTFSVRLKIDGLKDGQGIFFGDNKEYTISENGIYDIDTTENIRTNFIGECNITITQLPTSILKDFSGNGNHAYLYGGKGKLNSGMGVYQTDFTTWSKTNFDVHPEYIIATNGNNNLTLYGVKINSINVEIKGYNDKVKFLRLGYNNNDGVYKELNIFNDGIYTIPGCSLGQEGRLCSISLSLKEDTKITITQIPDYPDQLCYDGKMYAVCYGFPILTDYTVMADRTWFERQNRACFLSKITTSGTGAFGFEFYNEYNEDTTYSFGRVNNVEQFKDGITYQITNSYNGIVKLDYIVNGKDNAELYIGKLRPSERPAFIGCHGAIIIADRSFTEEEINWLKNNLFTIDIPTPAYDFDFSKYKDGSNLGDNITDKYGNVLELHNFAWKGMSGLGGYPIDLKATFPRNYTDGRDYICNDKEITCSYIGKSGLFQVLIVNQDITKYIEIPEFTIKISGSENIKLTYHYIKEDFTKGLLNIVGNGIYKIPKSYKADKIVENLNWLGFVLQNHMDENVDLKLEILPIYPGALVFDGIDDYARLAKMTIKTVVLDFVNLELDKQVYDNRDKPNNHNYFSIYPQADTVAYEARNSNGKTYINGELNTTIKTNDLLGVRCITCASNDLAKETEQYICRDSYLNNYYGKIALYRITGFTEMLTADQVWKWYQKNKAKGGDK